MERLKYSKLINLKIILNNIKLIYCDVNNISGLIKKLVTREKIGKRNVIKLISVNRGTVFLEGMDLPRELDKVAWLTDAMEKSPWIASVHSWYHPFANYTSKFHKIGSFTLHQERSQRTSVPSVADLGPNFMGGGCTLKDQCKSYYDHNVYNT